MRGNKNPSGNGELTNNWTDVNYPHQAGVDEMSSPRQYHYGAFWRGHRFGAQMSSLTLYGTASLGWGAKTALYKLTMGQADLLTKGCRLLIQIRQLLPTR